MQTVSLNTGAEMPILGLGVFKMSPDEVRASVPQALDMGYRLIDTASRYYNEEAVGAAIRESGVPREELFVTTKLWFKDHGADATRRAFEDSMTKLGLDYLDLWLIHQPFGDVYAAWRVMQELFHAGRVKAIGISNFYADRYLDLVNHMEVVPAVDQLETHPLHQRIAEQAVLNEHGTVLQSWGPLGQGRPEIVDSPVLYQIAQAHDASVQQIMLAWLAQRGIPMVAKSTKAERLQSNLDALAITLSADEMEQIRGLDQQRPNAGFDHRDPRLISMLMQVD